MNDCRDKLELKFGRRDLLDTLDEVRADVVAGKIEGLLVIGLREGEAGFHRTFAWKDDMEYRWARFAAAVGSAYHELQADGLPDTSVAA